MSLFRFLFFICLFITIQSFGQKQQYIYFVQFKNKPVQEFKPSQLLSQKSIDRRNKWKIDIEETDKPIDNLYIHALESIHGVIWQKSKWLNGVLVKFSNEHMQDSIAKFPFVSKVVYMQKFIEPKINSNYCEENKKSVSKYSNTKDIYGMSYRWFESLNAAGFMNQTYTTTDINIAVIDAGFLNVNKHNCFKHINISHTYDFVNNENNVYNDDAHGSEVLACLAATDSGTLVGTAPKATYILLRTEDALNEMQYEEILWAVAAEYADSIGVDLINSSLGYNIFDKGQSHDYRELDGKTTYIAQAANIASKKGIWIFVSAGNEGNDPWHFITTPADAFGVTSVGACNFEGKETYFTSSGPTADGRMSPIIAAPGLNIYTANTSSSNQYHFKNGSSYSTPIICGLAACLMQKYPNTSIDTLKQKLYNSCVHYPDTDLYIGYGMPQFDLVDSLLKNNKGQCQLKLAYNVLQTNIVEISYILCNENNFEYRVYKKKKNNWKSVRKKKVKTTKSIGKLELKNLKTHQLYKISLTQNKQNISIEFQL